MSKASRKNMEPWQKLRELDHDYEYWSTRSDAIALHVMDWIETARDFWRRVELGQIKVGTADELI